MDCNVLIVGAGPAGLAAAIHLDKIGIQNIVVLERQSTSGGILNQCIHTGFGLNRFKADLTGPEFAVKLNSELIKTNVRIEWNTMVTSIADGQVSAVSRDKGNVTYSPKAILLSVGCRERTLYQIGITGFRPAGIFMAGQAQALVNLLGLRIGKKVIIQGSGDVGLILARRLMLEGYAVDRVLESRTTLAGLLRNKVQCLDDFGIPLYLNHKITHVLGKERVEGVHIIGPDEEYTVPCDTAIFAVGLIPETDLLRTTGIKPELLTNPHKYRINDTKNIFLCGNARLIHETADDAAMDGEHAAVEIAHFLEHRVETNLMVNSPDINRKAKNAEYTSEFFDTMEDGDKIPCIVCPKGCFINESTYTCKKGLDYYFQRQRGEQKQRLTTSYTEEDGARIALVTKQPLIISEQIRMCDEIKNNTLRRCFINNNASQKTKISI